MKRNHKIVASLTAGLLLASGSLAVASASSGPSSGREVSAAETRADGWQKAKKGKGAKKYWKCAPLSRHGGARACFRPKGDWVAVKDTGKPGWGAVLQWTAPKHGGGMRSGFIWHHREGKWGHRNKDFKEGELIWIRSCMRNYSDGWWGFCGEPRTIFNDVRP